MPWARSQSAWRGRGRGADPGQLVDAHVGGDVLLAEPLERRAAPVVAGVGAQPVLGRAGRPARRWWRRSRSTTTRPPGAARCERAAQPAAGLVLHRHPGAERGVGRQARRPAADLVVLGRDQHLGEAHLARRRSRPAPPASRRSPRSRMRKAGCRAARWRARPPAGRARAARRGSRRPGRRRAGSGARCRRRRRRDGPSPKRRRGQVEVSARARPQRRRALDEHVAQRRRAGRLRQQHRAGQHPAAGAGLDHHERVGPAQLVPPARRGRGRRPRRTAGPTSGLVRKSPRRPARPPVA